MGQAQSRDRVGVIAKKITDLNDLSDDHKSAIEENWAQWRRHDDKRRARIFAVGEPLNC